MGHSHSLHNKAHMQPNSIYFLREYCNVPLSVLLLNKKSMSVFVVMSPPATELWQVFSQPADQSSCVLNHSYVAKKEKSISDTCNITFILLVHKNLSAM